MESTLCPSCFSPGPRGAVLAETVVLHSPLARRESLSPWLGLKELPISFKWNNNSMVASEGYLGCSKKAHTVPRSNGKIGKGKFWLNSQKKLLAGPPVLWSHLSHGRMDALLNCWSGLGFTLTGMLLCLPSCSAVLWPWTKTVKSPEEGLVWSCTQNRYSPWQWLGSNDHH